MFLFYNKGSYLTFEQLNRRMFGTTHDDKTTHIKAMKQMAILLQSVSQNLMIVLYLLKFQCYICYVMVQDIKCETY